MERKHNTFGTRQARLIDWSSFDHLIGTISDKEVAVLIGCTDTAVRDRRTSLGISPKHKTHRTKDEEAEYVQLHAMGQRRCTRCKNVKSITEYHRNSHESSTNGRDGLNRWCKACKSQYQSARIEEKRAYWLDLAGGCCQHCGFSQYVVSLDFHHIDSDTKDWVPGKLIMSRPIGDESVIQELDKCALLCCNCHQAIHRGGLLLTYEKRPGLGYTVKK